MDCSVDGRYKEDVPIENVDITTSYQALEVNDEVTLKSDMALNNVPENLKIIKSASARYKVEDVKKATRKIKKIAQKYRAYISDLRFENNLYKKENRFTIKIPQEHFDAMMDSIGFIVELIEYENISTEDVTEEYIDIQTRLKTKIEVKALYESIMREKAKTIEEILQTEEKLRLIQEEIESAQGRLKYLTNKVSYSTIQIDLYETVEYTEEPERYSKTFVSKSKEGLSFGWAMVEGFVIGLTYFWPLVVLGVILIVVIRKKLKKKTQNI
ncbi:hypothetical protein A9Q86_05545 [Flavobacteriales bacterium 33_180_T64]|nr:hypothetical protein A9Q86_05545 [Flavobacteriales bacterium 33_180_T64]